MSDITVGTCSLCGGRVVLHSGWYSTIPQIPQCTGCGATKKQPHGGIVEMEPAVDVCKKHHAFEQALKRP